MAWALVALLCLPAVAVLVDAGAAGWRAGAGPSPLVAGAISLWRWRSRVRQRRARSRLPPLAAGARLDSLGAVFLLATGLLYATTAAFSIGYLAADERRRDYRPFARRYFAYLNLFGWTMLLVPLAADFGTLWVAVELTTIVSALMVAIDRTDAALEASWKYVLIASSGLGIALVAIILLYGAGTAVLGDAYLPRFARVLGAADALPDQPVKLAFVLAVVGFGTKVGFVPMHTWLPDAHSEAPGAGLGAAVGVAAGGRVLRDPALLPGHRRDRPALVSPSTC